MSKIANQLEKIALPYNLNDREIQVLFLIANGKTNAEAGSILYLSPDTIKGDLKHAVEKIGLENRTAAVYIAGTKGVFQESTVKPLLDDIIDKI